jgi:nicotinamidase-related amidase
MDASSASEAMRVRTNERYEERNKWVTVSSITVPGRYYRTYPIGNPLGHAEDVLQLDVAGTVFLVVDVYGLGFGGEVSKDAPDIQRKFISDNIEVVTEHIVPARTAARRIGIPIIHLTNYLSEALTEKSELRNISLRCDGIDLLTAWREPSAYLAYSQVVAPGEGEYVVRKQHYSGFFDTGLDSLLRSLGAHNLVTVGFESRVCLGNTVTEAMYRNYRVIAIRDAIATGEEIETARGGWANFLAVRFIETHVGYTCTTEQWIGACTRIAEGT